MSNQELYQKLYDDPKRKYGQAEHGRCPGVRLIPHYIKYLHGKIIDFGSGTGDTVKALGDYGFEVAGYDFIKPQNKNCFEADITQPIDDFGNVAICIDVLEHLDDGEVVALVENLKKCKIQIITIHNGPSTEGGGVELHVNKKAFLAWERFLGRYLKIKHTIRIHDFQMLYICERGKV